MVWGLGFRGLGNGLGFKGLGLTTVACHQHAAGVHASAEIGGLFGLPNNHVWLEVKCLGQHGL